MSSIPQDVYFEILLRVPVKFTFICKCVCKTWYSLISSPNFIRKQLDVSTQKNYFNMLVRGHPSNSRSYQLAQLYSISYDSLISSTNELDITELDFLKFYKNHPTRLVGTCDGLVCIWNVHFNCFYLWNPATKEYKQIPKSPTKYGKTFFVDLFAFGYDCIIDDYKLVLVVDVNNEKEDYLVEVYTLGSNSWRNSQTIPYRTPLGEHRGVLVNGASHWLCKPRAEGFSTVLLSLDLTSETFKDIQPPKESLKSNHRFMSVGGLDGCLCVLVNVLDILQVWVMQDYGVPESWEKRYTITSERFISAKEHIMWVRLIWSFRNRELLFKYDSHRLVFYDPEQGSVSRNPVIPGLSIFVEDFYLESLVSLKSGKYVGRKTRRGIS